MEPIESVIGYKFRNSLLLAEALSHPSLAYETQKPQLDNQRLEFLGDAVVQMVLTRDLFDRFPEGEEGLLTKMRARMVSGPSLARIARLIPLGPYLLMGRGEDASGGRTRDSSLCDAFEALAGAIYLDGGLEPATQFILRFSAELLDDLDSAPCDFNPKGELQEILQTVSNVAPTYSILSQEGPDHAKRFVAAVTWEGRMLAQGEGASKKLAEMEAARAALGSVEVLALGGGGDSSKASAPVSPTEGSGQTSRSARTRGSKTVRGLAKRKSFAKGPRLAGRTAAGRRLP